MAFRTLLVALCFLGCHLVAANIADGILGYDVNVDCLKNQGWFYVRYYVPPNEIQQGNTSMWVRVASEHNPSVRGAMTIYWSFDKQADLNARPRIGNQFMGKGNNQREGKGSYAINGTGIYYISGQCDCQNQCPDDSQYGVVSARIEWYGHYRAFLLKNNPYTSNYTNLVNAGEFGPAGYLDLGADTNVHLLVKAYDPTTEVIMVYSKDMPIEKTSPLPMGADTAILKRYPSSTAPPLSGGYSTGPVTLTAGRWYIAPYLATKAPTNKPQEFKFAVGLGGEPDPTAQLSSAMAKSSCYVVLGLLLAMLALF
jgi:hypothetical protein